MQITPRGLVGSHPKCSEKLTLWCLTTASGTWVRKAAVTCMPIVFILVLWAEDYFQLGFAQTETIFWNSNCILITNLPYLCWITSVSLSASLFFACIFLPLSQGTLGGFHSFMLSDSLMLLYPSWLFFVVSLSSVALLLCLQCFVLCYSYACVISKLQWLFRQEKILDLLRYHSGHYHKDRLKRTGVPCRIF